VVATGEIQGPRMEANNPIPLANGGDVSVQADITKRQSGKAARRHNGRTPVAEE
jgi:hypothetical protein